ncbi:MAG: hypothetical protein WCV86_03565 [Patescibacteria group bacterium]|jgi:hypothetical protein
MESTTYNKGEPVPNTGQYICAPCGFKKEFKKGESFPECTSCLSGSAAGREEYIEGLELWEKIRDFPKDDAEKEKQES